MIYGKKIEDFMRAAIIILTVCFAATGCDFISGFFSKKDKAVENAYMDYRKAFLAGDVESLKNFVSKRKVQELEGEQAASMLQIARAFSPPQATVTGTAVEGDAATLTVTAEAQGGTMKGIVHMLREDGKWKVYEEKWDMRIQFGGEVAKSEGQGTPPAPGEISQGQSVPSEQPAETGKKGDAQGEAVIVRDGVQETYILKTGFFSDTRFKDPRKAVIEFQIPGGEHSNARRIRMTLDATRDGRHYVDGKLASESFMNEEKLKIGESTSRGFTANLQYIADGGQIFYPKDSCDIVVTSPYSAAPDGFFSGDVSDCIVHSAGIDHNISSVKFTMRGIPSH